MAFIRTKRHRTGGNEYHYLVESYRNADGQPRQRHIKYLGKMTIGDGARGAMARNALAEELDYLNEIEAAFFGDQAVE